MSGSSSYNTYESEDESTGWLMSSEISVDDELSDELTLLNGDEDCDEEDDTSSFEALIKLSMRLKKQFNLREAAVQLERCDKIWDTMQLVKEMQLDMEVDTGEAGIDGREENEEEAKEEKYRPPWGDTLRLPEGSKSSSIPYIKYQPVQGNGNNALPNFYLAVKSQKKLYNCVTCGKQYSEERSLRLHSEKEHGVVMPKTTKKSRKSADIKPVSQLTGEDKIVNNGSSKDRETAGKSRLSGTQKHLSEAKKEGETSSADDTGEKAYICPICGTAYTYQRSMTSHMTNVHDMSLEEAKLAFRQGDTIIGNTKRVLKREISQKVEELRNKKEGAEGASSVRRSRYIYTCKPCGKTYTEKHGLRGHASKIHDIVIPLSRKSPLSINGQIRNYAHYTCEIKRPPVEGEEQRGSKGPIDEDKSLMRSIVKDERPERARTMRSGRLLGDPRNGTVRPRRACAANTSYTECTKEEEEVLQRELILSNTAGGSATKSLNGQTTTPCFLCKKAFVDIRKHLVDYHRINCPETILPLASNVTESQKDKASLDSRETLDSVVKSTEKRRKVEQTDQQLKESNKYIRLLSKKSTSVWNKRRYQCVLCCYKFNRRYDVQRHLDYHTINGLVQEHTSERQRKRKNIVQDPLVVDPLALTDFPQSSISESQGNARSDEDDPRISGRNIMTEDQRVGSTNYEHLNKRRKLEEPIREFINPPGSDSTSDSVQQYNNEQRESVLVMADMASCRLNEEEKSANLRDTRDSSDRDSGIGISITIKKRNNSYEVVEKESSGDDEKSKDFEHSKDDNTCSDSSSSDVTPAVFLNDDQQARRREILNSLDYSVKDNVVETARDEADYVDVETFDKKTKEVSCSSDDKEANYCWKEEIKHLEKDACTSFLGNVPSLKVMCTTVLKKDLPAIFYSNRSISHQCPVCYRFYSTERDVTVHMLEHKVSRTDFRATRVHAIPSSALRRYGRRTV